MKRYIKSYIEPDGAELGHYMDQHRDELKTEYAPFVVEDFLDIYFNSHGYKIFLPTGETWFAVKTLSPQGYKLYGDYVNPKYSTNHAFPDDDLMTTQIFPDIDAVMSYLFAYFYREMS